MPENSMFEMLGDALVDLPTNVVEDVFVVLGEFGSELQELDHDDIVKIVSAAVSGAAGAGARHHLERHGAKLEAAVRRALAT